MHRHVFVDCHLVTVADVVLSVTAAGVGYWQSSSAEQWQLFCSSPRHGQAGLYTV